ncbi:MAG: TonB family protein [Bacteroidales bacterium]|nr:TonB family protein [Bacteroidales bacterium]
MNDPFIYLLKVSAGIAIIFLPYYFLFRNDPNLHIKRFYLLAGIAAAWIFPFITFRKVSLAVDLTPTVFIDLDTPGARAVQFENAGASAGLSINWLQVIIFIYLAGLSIMFLKNLFIILKWNFTWLRMHDDQGVAYIKNDQVFTLFNRIFVPASLREEENLDNVLLHEKAHIQQLHFIDLMLMELTLLLTWFNPFSWLISRMIKENHEHLADRQVLSAGINPARYKAQLMNHTLGVNVFRLGAPFNHSLTLKRFKMMKKPKKSPLGLIKIALLIPVILITLGLTTGMTPQQKTVKGKVVIADTGEPAMGASVVIRNSTVGCVVDKDGSFMLSVEGDPELVISFVGYSSLVVKASEIGKKPLKLEVETYTLDLETVTMEVKGKSSGTFTIKQKDGSDAQPVFVVDGKVVKEIDKLDPESIDNISVFKDPDSEMVKKYKAKDGVVMITTKKTAEVSGKDEMESIEINGEVFYVVEDMPKYPGGLGALKAYIYSNLEYPEKVKEQGIGGEVIVRFLINEEGKAVKGEVLRSSYAELDAPALKVISEMPDWTPGKQRGKAVKVWYVMSIPFDGSAK